MNVLLLAEVSAAAVIGGAERVLREQAVGLRGRGHCVGLITRAPDGDSRTVVNVEGAIEQRYRVSRSHHAALFVISSVVRSLEAFDRAQDGAVPDVVLIHQALAGLGPVLRRRASARGWVYVCHSLAHEEYLSRSAGSPAAGRPGRWLQARLRRWIERAVIGRCSHVLVLSEHMKQRVMAVHGVREERIRVVPGGADPARFRSPADPSEVRRRLKLPLDRVVLLTVRNLVPRMGLEQLIGAIARLGPEGADLLVLIGGEGPLRSALDRLIIESKLATQVRLMGFIPELDLPLYYQAADLVVMPTRELEGFGLVTVEALACGTPVVGTPVGGIPEILSRIDPGLIAGGTNADAIADALRALLRRFRDVPGEEQRVSERGQRLVAQEYTWERHCQRVEAMLHEAVG